MGNNIALSRHPAYAKTAPQQSFNGLDLWQERNYNVWCRWGTYDFNIATEQRNYAELFNHYEGGHVMDIGANIGCFSVYALREFNVNELTAYEPDEENFSLLKLNTSNKPVNAIHGAITPKNEVVKFYQNMESNNRGIGSTIYKNRKGTLVTEVQGYSFIDEMKRLQPELIKIDIEGAEFELSFKEIPDCVKAISLELHMTKKQYKQVEIPRVLSELQSSGFKIPNLTGIKDNRGFELVVRR